MGRVKVMKRGKQVASARNLEVITRYQRTHSAIKDVEQKGHTLIVKYEDGAVCRTKFASETVLEGWIYRKRRRGTFPPPAKRRPKKKR